jgi:hypothetical protein
MVVSLKGLSPMTLAVTLFVKQYRRKRSRSDKKYYPVIGLEGLRNATRHINQYSRYFSQDLNRVPTEHRYRVIQYACVRRNTFRPSNDDSRCFLAISVCVGLMISVLRLHLPFGGQPLHMKWVLWSARFRCSYATGSFKLTAELCYTRCARHSTWASCLPFIRKRICSQARSIFVATFARLGKRLVLLFVCGLQFLNS